MSFRKHYLEVWMGSVASIGMAGIAGAGVTLPSIPPHTSPTFQTLFDPDPDVPGGNGFFVERNKPRPFNGNTVKTGIVDFVNRTANFWHLEFEMVNTTGAAITAGKGVLVKIVPLGATNPNCQSPGGGGPGQAFCFYYPINVDIPINGKFQMHGGCPLLTNNKDRVWNESASDPRAELTGAGRYWNIVFQNNLPGLSPPVMFDAAISECNLANSALCVHSCPDPNTGEELLEELESPSDYNGTDPVTFSIEIKPCAECPAVSTWGYALLAGLVLISGGMLFRRYSSNVGLVRA